MLHRSIIYGCIVDFNRRIELSRTKHRMWSVSWSQHKSDCKCAKKNWKRWKRNAWTKSVPWKRTYVCRLARPQRMIDMNSISISIFVYLSIYLYIYIYINNVFAWNTLLIDIYNGIVCLVIGCALTKRESNGRATFHASLGDERYSYTCIGTGFKACKWIHLGVHEEIYIYIYIIPYINAVQCMIQWSQR